MVKSCSSLTILLGCCLLSACDATSGNNAAGGGQSPDPVVVDLPIAYVERALPVDEDGQAASEELLDPAAFHPGAKLILKDRAQASAPETNITDSAFATSEDEPAALYDVKDLEISDDGSKLLFAMRAPKIENADDDEQPTWNIWEYDTELDSLRRIITSDITAEQGEDIAPHYLPDGRIVFSSTRQRRTRAILLDENKPQYAGLTEDGQQEAFVLHVMDEDGQNIEQITFNQSHDLQPTVLDDGRIAYLRWDNYGRRDRLSLYTVNPDGTEPGLLYGYHSQETATAADGDPIEAAFTHPQPMPDGRLLVMLKQREAGHWGGEPVAIDTANFIDLSQPVPANAGDEGPAQESLAALPVLIDGGPSPHGYFNSATPLFDGTGRMLVSWSQCRVIDPATAQPTFCTDELLDDPAVESAPPLYGLWVYDATAETQLPVVLAEEGVMVSDPVVLAPRIIPEHIPPATCDADCEALKTAGVGVVHIRSVYDLDGTDTAPNGIAATADPLQTPVADRPARFLRILKPVPIPDDEVVDFDSSAFGVSANQLMREIVGYVPIEPDGSVKFQVPADIAFSFAVLDADGRRIGGRHRNWLTVQAGEVRECSGCHTANSELPHGRPDAALPSANAGAPATGVNFINTQLVDEFGTPETGPAMSQTMAEYYSSLNGPRTPSMDIEFRDEWTDPAAAAKADSFTLSYAAIAQQHRIQPETQQSSPPENCPALPEAPPVWTAPAANCTSANWNSLCRTVIHYPEHIHPLWEADRRTCDESMNVVTNHTCTSCHSEQGALGSQVPAGQLDLTGGPSDANILHMTSYQELLAGDTEQILDDEGNLTERVEFVETGEFQVDADGNLVLDENGDPIPITVPVTFPVPQSMSVNGARASNRFFARFDGTLGPDEPNTVDHTGMLSPDELKLIAEWLDIGGQYYNNPFDAPVN